VALGVTDPLLGLPALARRLRVAETEAAVVARMIAGLAPRRSLKVVKGDMLPERLPFWNLVMARDGDEDWSVGLRCPCGCAQRLEMMLLKEVKPRWDLSVDPRGHVSCIRRSGCARDANRISGCGQADRLV